MEPEISKTEPRRPVSTHFSCFWPVSGLLTHVNCEQWTLWMSHIGTVDTVDVSYWHIGQCLCVEHTQCLCGTHTVSLWQAQSVSVAQPQCLSVEHTQSRCAGGRWAGGRREVRGQLRPPWCPIPSLSLTPIHPPKIAIPRCGGTSSVTPNY